MMHATEVNYAPENDYQGATDMSKAIEWITTAEAAEIIESTIANVTYLCRKGEIRCEKFGRVWKVSKQDAIDYVRSGRVGRKQDE